MPGHTQDKPLRSKLLLVAFVTLFTLAALLSNYGRNIVVAPAYIGPVPQGALTRLGKGGISMMALSPNGRYLAVGNSVGIYLYRTGTLTQMWASIWQGYIEHLEFSPDSQTLVIFTGTELIEWSVRTGQVLQTTTVPRESSLHHSDIFWSSNRPTRLAVEEHRVVGRTPDGINISQWVINLIDLETAKIAQQVMAGSDCIDTFVFNPDGTEIATIIERYIVTILDMTTGVSQKICLPDIETAGLVYSPAGSLLAVGAYESAFIVDPSAGEILHQLSPVDGTRCLAFDPDGTTLAVGAGNGSITLWDTLTGEQIEQLETHSSVRDLAWGVGARTLFVQTEEPKIIVWDVLTGKPLYTLDDYLNSPKDIAWSPDSKKLATSTSLSQVHPSDDLGVLLIWDVGGELLHRVEYPVEIGSVAWSPTNTMLALRASGGNVLFVDVETLTVTRRLDLGDDRERLDIAWSPNGSKLAIALTDREVLVYDVLAGQILHSLKTLPDWRPSAEFPINPVISLAWSPRGNQLAAGMWDGPGYIWNVETGQELAVLEHHLTPFSYFNSVIDVNWSPDGRLVAGGFHYDGKMKWDEESQEYVPAPADVIAIWDAATGEKHQALQTLAPFGYSSDWSPTGALLALSLYDKGLLLWDTANPSQRLADDLPVLDGPEIYQVSWSPDGTMLAYVQDGTIIIREIDR